MPSFPGWLWKLEKHAVSKSFYTYLLFLCVYNIYIYIYPNHSGTLEYVIYKNHTGSQNGKPSGKCCMLFSMLGLRHWWLVTWSQKMESPQRLSMAPFQFYVCIDASWLHQLGSGQRCAPLRRGPWRQRAAWRPRTVAVQGLFRAVPRSRASAASPIEKPAKTHAGQSHESKPQGLWKCHGWAIAVPPKRMQPTHSFTCFDFGDMLLIELESNLQFIYLLVINRGNWNPLLMEMSKGTSSINNYK